MEVRGEEDVSVRPDPVLSAVHSNHPITISVVDNVYRLHKIANLNNYFHTAPDLGWRLH